MASFLYASFFITLKFIFSQGTESPLLFEAVLEANRTLVRQIIECNWADVNSETAFGMTGLMEAANLGKNDIIEVFLNSGANINGRSAKTGWSALMHAAANGWVETVRLLLNRGAETSFTDSHGNTAFTVAPDGAIRQLLYNRTVSPSWSSKSSSILLTPPSRNSLTSRKHPPVKRSITYPLFSAVIRGQISLVRSMIFAGADVNYQDRQGVTALMLAAYYGHKELLKLLLKAHAEIDYQNADGWTALFFAASRHHPKIVRLLLDNGADIEVKSMNGATPLMISAMESYDVLRLLISKKADINAIDNNGATALFYAAESQLADAVELLAAKGASLNPKKVDGSTPLMFAVQRGDLAMAKVLLELRANVNARTKDGATALMYATFNGDRQLVKLLVERYHADVTLKTVNGLIAPDYATDYLIQQFLNSKIPQTFFRNGTEQNRYSVILCHLVTMFLCVTHL